MLEDKPIRSMPDLRREERSTEQEEVVVEMEGLGMVRGGAILAVPDAPVRVLGSGRRGGGSEPMEESGEVVLTVGVGEQVPVK